MASNKLQRSFQMPKNSDPSPEALREAAHSTLVAELRNVHALEKQAVAVLESQLDRMHDYPDLHARISAHALESREQSRRLETSLDVCGASHSVAKDVLMTVMGVGQSSAQGFADDAVIKAVLADIMFEHLEIASYRSLIEVAQMAGKSELVPRLEESLREEEAMATWLDEHLKAITRRYVELSAGEIEAGKKSPALDAGDDTEADVASDVAAIEKEARAREARKRETLDRVAVAAGGVAAAPRDGDSRTVSGDETTRRSGGGVGEDHGSDLHSPAGEKMSENPNAERGELADNDAARARPTTVR
jgi:ferritin-like metal-binding protein YciE